MTTLLRFTTAQAAEYASRHIDTVTKACTSGELHAGQRKKRGHWSIRRECLDAWLDGQPCPHQRTTGLAASA